MASRWQIVVAALAVTFSTAPAFADQAKCRQLAALFDRHTNYRSSGQGPYLERKVAAEECRKGNTEVGIPMLEGALTRHQIDPDWLSADTVGGDAL